MGRTKSKICHVCLGTKRMTCWQCKLLEGNFDREGERNRFLLELWQKAKKYNMHSLGNAKVDKEVIVTHGFWRTGVINYYETFITIVII